MKIINNPSIVKSIKFQTVSGFGAVNLIAISSLLNIKNIDKIVAVKLLKRLFFLIRKILPNLKTKSEKKFNNYFNIEL
jgi:hypothetical protein